MEVKVTAAMNTNYENNIFMPSTGKSVETDINMDELFMIEIIELLFNCYSNCKNKFSTKDLT